MAKKDGESFCCIGRVPAFWAESCWTVTALADKVWDILSLREESNACTGEQKIPVCMVRLPHPPKQKHDHTVQPNPRINNNSSAAEKRYDSLFLSHPNRERSDEFRNFSKRKEEE